MSDKKNGAQFMEKLVDGTSEERQEMMKVGAQMYASLMDWYRQQVVNYHDMEPLQLAITMATVTGQYNAVLAVDLNMPKDRYLRVCGVFHDNASKRAPRFG